MAKPTKAQILNQIRTAVVEVVASKGIGAASVADIARAAKVSPGTIYLHFENKDDLLQKTYLHIKLDFHKSLMTAADAPNSKEIVKGMWFNLFAFLLSKPLDFRFLEYAGAAQVLTEAQRAEVAPLQDEINHLIQAAMDDGTLTPMPLNVAVSLLIGPAMHLARTAAMTGTPARPDEVDQTFDRIWSSLRA